MVQELPPKVLVRGGREDPTTLLTVASRFMTTYTPGQWLFLLDHGRPNRPPRLTGIGELMEVAFEIGHAADPIVTSPRRHAQGVSTALCGSVVDPEG